MIWRQSAGCRCRPACLRCLGAARLAGGDGRSVGRASHAAVGRQRVWTPVEARTARTPGNVSRPLAASEVPICCEIRAGADLIHEWFDCVEGEFVIEIGQARLTRNPGDSVLAPRRVPHVWACVDAMNAVWQRSCRPALTCTVSFSPWMRSTRRSSRRYHTRPGRRGPATSPARLEVPDLAVFGIGEHAAHELQVSLP